MTCQSIDSMNCALLDTSKERREKVTDDVRLAKRACGFGGWGNKKREDKTRQERERVKGKESD